MPSAVSSWGLGLVLAATLASGLRAAPAVPAAASATLPATKPVKIDDSALRYYAQHHQMDRVKIELKRLQALYPGYKIPKDAFAPVADAGGPEDQPLWDLFGADKLDELEARIKQHEHSDPSWHPPLLLVTKLHVKMMRAKILAMYKAAKWDNLLALAKTDPSAFSTKDLDLMWKVAAAAANAHKMQQSLSLYETILKTEQDPQKRIATLQMAMAHLPMASIEDLYAMGHVGPDGRNEFDVILTDITRARIVAFLHDTRPDNIKPQDFASFRAYVKTATDPNQPGLVGWYYYKRADYPNALKWFKLAISKGGDGIIAHGLARSLLELGNYPAAEAVSYAWRDHYVPNSMLYIDILGRQLAESIPPYVSNQDLANYAGVTLQTSSGEGAQALGWYAYNSCQYHAALQWFHRAAAWYPKESTIKGLALTYKRLGDMPQFVATVNRYDGLFPDVVALVFPDDHYTTPLPCEQSVMAPLAAPVLAAPAAIINQAGQIVRSDPPPPEAMAYAPGTAPNYQDSFHDPLWRYVWGYVPSPTGEPYQPVQPNYHGQAWHMPVYDPRLFPVAVNPQNPLRYATLQNPAPDAPARLFAIAEASPSAPEPFTGPWPALARKVSGAPAMPYQSNGYKLISVMAPRAKGATGDDTQPHYQFVPPPPAIDPGATGALDRPAGLPYQPLIQPIPAAAPVPQQQLPYVAAPAVPAPPQRRTTAPRRASARDHATAQRLVIRHDRRAARTATTCGSAEGTPRAAVAAGWCLMHLNRSEEASQAFWRGTAGAGSTRADAFYGMALAGLNSGLRGPARSALQSGTLSPQRQRQIDAMMLGLEANDDYRAGHYRAALAALDRKRSIVPEQRSDSLMRAWSLLNLSKPRAAFALFQALDRQVSTADSRRGLGVAEARLTPGNN